MAQINAVATRLRLNGALHVAADQLEAGYLELPAAVVTEQRLVSPALLSVRWQTKYLT